MKNESKSESPLIGERSAGPEVTTSYSCFNCKYEVSERYRCQSDSGHDVYCTHPSFPERKRIGDTTWNTPEFCPFRKSAKAKEDSLPEATMQVHYESRRRWKDCPETIPMSLLNEDWAMNNHSQTLKRLNERGGLAVLEILDNIHKRRLSFSTPETQAHVDELRQLLKLESKEDNKAFGEQRYTLSQMYDFVQWYSGVDRLEIMAAYTRYLREKPE